MPFDTISATMRGPLATATLGTLKTYFTAHQHNPSGDHWNALGDIATTLEAMADGTCEPRVFLSAIDPGVGKSQTTLHFARALLASQDHRGIGMIVCVGRIAEAEAMAQALADHRDRLAVLTGDDTANALGCADPTTAQLLITTQQRIERNADGKDFADVAAFRFNGTVRQVRVWDEAWLPGLVVSVDHDEIAALLKPARRVSQDFRDGLRAFAAELEASQTGSLIDVPDWPRLYGVTLQDILEATSGGRGGLRDDERAAATGVFTLAGRTAAVWKDNRTGSAFLSYRETLPKDLAPLLVLDASGRVRQTYADMIDHRGLVPLRAAVKDYGPLTVHHWKMAGSKTAFGKQGAELVRGIAETIMTKATERWLVVVHKRGGKVRDVEAALRKSIPAAVGSLVSIITWGNHMATNDYADVGNLILAGTLFMRPSHYVGLTHLAQDRPTAGGFAPDADVRKTTEGEHANFVLQAICRGRVRKSADEKCLPMDAYIIAAPSSGIAGALPAIFPRCSVVAWRPTTQTVASGKLKEAIAFVRARIAAGATWVGLAEVRTALRMNDGSFKTTVMASPLWAATLQALALVDCAGPRKARGLAHSVGIREGSQTPKKVRSP